jgi:LPS sulfotransferase NodH
MFAILLAHPRTGSNFLRNILNSHPDVTMYNELFNLHQFSQEIIRNPVKRFEQLYQQSAISNQKVVGFKLLYDQCSNEDFIFHSKKYNPHPEFLKRTAKVLDLMNIIGHHLVESRSQLFWNHIISDTSISIIHLKRRNYLRTYISLVNALKTDQWTGQKKQLDYSPLELNIEDCESFFEHLEKKEQYYSGIFQLHRTIDICYEDLVQNPIVELKKIANILKIDVSNLINPPSRSAVALSHQIKNLGELTSHFKHTKWEEFLQT